MYLPTCYSLIVCYFTDAFEYVQLPLQLATSATYYQQTAKFSSNSGLRVNLVYKRKAHVRLHNIIANIWLNARSASCSLFLFFYQ